MKKFNVGMIVGMSLMMVGANVFADQAGKLVAHCTGIDNAIVADIYLNGDGSLRCDMSKIPTIGTYSSRLTKKKGTQNVLVADVGSTIELSADGPKSYVAVTTMNFLFGKKVRSRCEVDIDEAKAHGVIAEQAPESLKGNQLVAEQPAVKEAADGGVSAAGSGEAKKAGLVKLD